MSQSFTLYRFFDSEDRLLYVGRTINPASRWRDHERKKPWFDDVATVKRQVYPSYEALTQAEGAAILSEAPLYNVQGNLGRHKPMRIIPAAGDAAWPEVAAKRWDIWGIEPNPSHDLDETFCECMACHVRREERLNDLACRFDFHPDIAHAVEEVRARYIDGAELVDWYYDLDDVTIFGRMALASASRLEPLPCHAEFGDNIAVACCLACPDSHRFAITSGQELLPVPASCGAVLSLYDDWAEAVEDRYGWGERAAKRAAAA